MINWLNTNQGSIMALLTAVYVIATIIIALMAKHSNKLAQKNIDTLTKLEKERLKPAITAEILADYPFYNIHIVNQGQTTALDIKFEFTPKLCIFLGKSNSEEKTEKPIGFIKNGIASLPPGGALSSIIGTYELVTEKCPDLIFHGKVTYRDREGTQYEDKISLDLHQFEGNYHKNSKSIHDVAILLKEIKTEINYLATGFHKPHILTQNIKEHRQENLELHRELDKVIQNNQSSPPANQEGNTGTQSESADA